MNGLSAVLEPLARITVATLFNSLWEAALLAFAVWAILRVFPNLNATTRYAAWCAALVGALLLPLATAIPQISVQHAPAASTVIAPLQQTASSSHATASTHASAAHASVADAQHSVAPATASTRFKLPGRVHFALPQYLAIAIFGVWVAAALAMLIRLAVNLWLLERLKSDALPLPVDYRERLSEWASADKGLREVRLCTCDRIDVPVAVGLFDSMILLPQHLLETLSPQEVDQIMLHELGHLRRADDWTNGLQRLIQALFFFNPAVLYISQQLDLEREVACDDWVLRQTKKVRPYASCLTRMAEVTAWPHRPLAAPGVFVTRRGLSIRIERLLRAGRNVRTSLSFGAAGGVVAALVVLFFLLQSVAPSFAFTLPAPLDVASKPVAKAAPERHKTTPVKSRPIAQVAQVAPAPAVTDISIPAIHVHRNAQTVHIPAVNVNIPARHLSVPAAAPQPAASWLPKNFSSDLEHRIRANVADSMGSASAITGAALSAAGISESHYAKNGNNRFDCVGCDYSGQNLAGRSFHGRRMSGADFSRANLQNADFSNAVLTGVDFSKADVRGASFAGAVLTGCDFSHAQLANARFDGARMTGCDITARDLSPTQARAVLVGCRASCDMSGANLSHQDLRNLNLTGVDLSGADLRGSDFSNSSLQGVDFSAARMDGARFTGASITGCDFTGVDITRIDFSNAKLRGDKLSQ